VGGGYEKKVLCSACFLLVFIFSHERVIAEETYLNIHQKVSVCFSDMGTIFPVNLDDYSDPTSCDEVCMKCHESVPEVFPAQSDNIEGAAVGAIRMEGGSSQGWEDLWTSLAREHKECRSCHTDYAQNVGNHPIFVSFSLPESHVLKTFDGVVLCATCHNPHAGETSGLLRTSNKGSAVCLACHNM